MKRSTGAYFLWRSSSCPAGFPQGNWNYLHNRAAAVAWMKYGDAMIIQGLNTILEMLSVSTYQQVLHLKLACNDSSVRLLMASFSIKWSRYTFNRLPLSYYHAGTGAPTRNYCFTDLYQFPFPKCLVRLSRSLYVFYAHEESRLNEVVETGEMWCSFVVSSY